MFYLIVFGIILLLAVLNIQFHDKLSNQVFMGVSALIMMAVAGLRFETGGDWDSYKLLFDWFPPFHDLITHPSELARQPVEEGFVLLCAFVKMQGGTIQELFIVVAVINILLISISLPKYTKYPVVALLCYYCILFFQLEMIYIRQATAVAICFFAIRYIDQRKFFKYMLLVLLACTFHRVAMLMIPLYFVLHKRVPTWVYAGVIGFGALIRLLGVSWIRSIYFTVAGLLGGNYTTKAEIYADNNLFAVSRGLSIGFVLNLAILFIVLCFKKKIDEKPYGTILLNMFALSLVFYYYAFEFVEASNRVRYFFLIGVIALLPMVLEFLPIYLHRLAGLGIITIYCFSFSMGIFLETPQAAAYNPYQNYLEFRHKPKESTGQKRLEESKKAFREERKR